MIDLDTLLKEEYFFLQKSVEDFDSKTLTIKAWSITGSLVAIATGLSDKGCGSPLLFLVASAAALVFWVIEAIYQCFVSGYDKRIVVLENYFADMTSAHKPIPLQIFKTWSKHEGASLKQVMKKFIWPVVMLPHVVIVIAGIAIYLAKLR